MLEQNGLVCLEFLAEQQTEYTSLVLLIQKKKSKTNNYIQSKTVIGFLVQFHYLLLLELLNLFTFRTHYF